MKNTFLFAAMLLTFCSCKKSIDAVDAPIQIAPPPAAGMVEYTIPKGQQYCDKNGFQTVSVTEMKFNVTFDSSAIYQTIDPANQVDINKLYGFSDNNSDHHQFSSRFGWRWRNNQLQIFAYIYNNGVMSFQQIGVTEIGKENNCSIKVVGNTYLFSMNELSVTMPRASTTATGAGYKLYPYFGGNEMAPHDIHIWMRDAN